MILFISKVEGDIVLENYQLALKIIDSFVRGVFIVFAATLIAKLIIGEYKNRTITTAFMYPIKRKKLIAAKLAIIIIFTFISIVVSNVFITVVFCFISTNYQLIPDALTYSVVMQQIPAMLMNAIAATGMSLIPLYFGMKKYSIPTTILSSLLMVMVVSSNTGNFSLNDIIVIPITLAIIGISVAYLSIRNIESVDV